MGSNTEAAIWTRIIHPEGDMSPAAASRILRLALPPGDREKMRLLVQRSKLRPLSVKEEDDLDNFCRVARMLSILKSQARKVLQDKHATSE